MLLFISHLRHVLSRLAANHARKVCTHQVQLGHIAHPVLRLVGAEPLDVVDGCRISRHEMDDIPTAGREVAEEAQRHGLEGL